MQLKKENDHLEGTICIDLETVRLWDNHDPYLYHAYVELKAEDGSLVEVIPYDIGFRRIEIIDKIIYLNGKRLVITGVNRHEWNPKTGRCIGLEDMRADIACMLRNNINSVRTCHYPDRKAGAPKGVYEVTDLSLTPYLVPQECGMRMDTEWLEISRHTSLDNSRTDQSSQTLRIEKTDREFAFSCLPYTASEIS